MDKIKPVQIKNPQFIFGEIPIKDKSWQDQRIWIYCVNWLSLIECFCLNDIDVVFPDNQVQKTFKYKNSDGVVEEWLFVFTQNNIAFVNEGKDAKEVLSEAWEWFEMYLIWEDINIDFPE